MVAVGLLTRLGYRAEVVDNGPEAVEAVASGRYRAVLMDCQLPGMDGYQATAEIRRREGGTGRIPIIAMTAAALQDDRARCLAAGMDDYVSKPVLMADLDAVLSRWLQGEPPPLPPRAGDAVDPVRLLDMFRALAPVDLLNLRAAVKAGDAVAVDRAAHHLKGAAATVGLDRVVALCGRLELLGGAGALEPAGDVLAALEEELERWGAAG